MSIVLISLIISVGAATWLYGQIMRTTGNNTKNALIGAGIAGAGAFLFLWMVLSWIM